MTRQALKRTLENLFPRALANRVLTAWRRFYWWNQGRLRPGHTRRVVAQLLANGRPIQLELGAGPREGMEDWVSLNITAGATIRHDLTKPLPFPNGTVQKIYSSHVLEHFTYPQPLLHVLRDCHRVLKPGATFSAAVPNARLYLQAYFSPENFDRGTFCGFDVGLSYDNRIDVVNFIAYLGGEHKVMFDEENLPHIVEEAGFRNVRIREFDASVDLPQRRHESIYVEAVK